MLGTFYPWPARNDPEQSRTKFKDHRRYLGYKAGIIAHVITEKITKNGCRILGM